MMHRPYKTWIELDRLALRYNIDKIRSKIGSQTKLLAVVKSNAYGHGLTLFSECADNLPGGGGVDGFCVDSVIEGRKLRGHGIKKPILVLGTSLPAALPIAQARDVTITISESNTLHFVAKKYPLAPFHLKIDTGLHRQGFYPSDLMPIIQYIKKNNLNLTGVYSHLAMADNKNFSQQQLAVFKNALGVVDSLLPNKKIIRHIAATGGTLLGKDFHYDAVRVGMGLYGCRSGFKPVLRWKAIVSELKQLNHGDYVGYDMTRHIAKQTCAAVIPIGYWHGFDRGLSNLGYVTIRGKKAPVLGRVSMDIIVVDVSRIPCKIGDTATIIGSAAVMAKQLDTSPYEIITRINPLIKKVVIN